MAESSPHIIAPLRQLAALTGVGAVVLCSHCRANALFGGPAYDAQAGVGYFPAGLSDSIAEKGVAAGHALKYVNGTSVGNRAFRWSADPNGFVELGNLGTNAAGWGGTWVRHINAEGAAVGFSFKVVNDRNLGSRAVRWDLSDSAAVELSAPSLLAATGETRSFTASAISLNGTVVGYGNQYFSDGSSAGNVALRWRPGSTIGEVLGNLGTASDGAEFTGAEAVSASGVAIGSAGKYVGGVSFGRRAVRWDANGTTAVELGHIGTDLTGSTDSRPFAINALGAIVGNASKFSGGIGVGSRAVRWNANDTAATELGVLGTDATGNTYAGAFSINSSGTSIGSVTKYVSSTYVGFRATRWDATGTIAIELGNLGTDSAGKTTTACYSINEDGTIVGYAHTFNGDIFAGLRAVAWGSDGVAKDLNAFVSPADAEHWTLTIARGISNSNWVVGYGDFDPDGPGPLPSYQRPFTLQIPEPASALGWVACGISLLRCRSQSQRRVTRPIRRS